MKNRKLDKDKVDRIKDKVNIDTLGPRILYKSEIFEDMSGGWRPGYTKPTIEARKAHNRLKNKQARKSRRINRKRK